MQGAPVLDQRGSSRVAECVPVTDVARRYGVARQTVHQWLRRYANEGGLGGLADLAEAGLVPAADARCGGGVGGPPTLL